MRALLLRSLRLRIGRTLRTSIAVVIGVALIAGTLVFTDTINRTFDAIGDASYRGVAAAVTPNTPPGAPDAQNADDEQMLPRSIAERVARVDGVRRAHGQVTGTAIIFERDGRTRIGGHGPPSLLLSTMPEGFGDVRYPTGRAPRAPDEVALDRATAEKAEADVGDRVWIQGEGPRRAMRLSGVVQLGDGSAGFGGATIAVTTEATAAELAGRTDEAYYSEVLALTAGPSDEEVVAAIRGALGDAATVRTGLAEGDQQAQDIKDAISFLPTILLVFAGIATFVGSFLIFNTFSITMAQRQREFALLRALGADRRQVRRLVVGEALAVGILGSLLGIAAGFAVAPGLRSLIESMGVDMPTTGTVLAARTVLVGFAVGLTVTLLASWAPAGRATRVPPVEALREAAAPPARGAVRRGPIVAGALLAALGALGVLSAVVADASTAVAGIGAGALVLGAILGTPALVGPLAGALGRPMRRLFGLPGRLAGDNAARQPGRTALTAGALMIGLALVVFATVFAAGLKETLRGDLEDVVTAPVVVQETDNGFNGLPRALVTAVAQAPGVSAAGGATFGAVGVEGRTVPVTALDAALFRADLVHLERDDDGEGTAAPGPGEAYLTDDHADELGKAAGDVIEVIGTSGATARLRIIGVVRGTATAVTGVVMNERTAAGLGMRRPFFVLADGDPAAIERAIARDYPSAEAKSRSDWISDQVGQVDQILGLVYALLALSIVVALLGIVNTLNLSTQERVRELGLLRAVGATRRQVRRMIVLEALITALLGAALGAVLGFALAAAVGTTLDGFSVSVPVGEVVTLVLVAAVLGVLAAVRPARRAARVDVLEAIAEA